MLFLLNLDCQKHEMRNKHQKRKWRQAKGLNDRIDQAGFGIIWW